MAERLATRVRNSMNTDTKRLVLPSSEEKLVDHATAGGASDEAAPGPTQKPASSLDQSGWKGVWQAIKCAYDRFLEHRSDLLGAALAFYTLLSLAPLLIVMIALLGWVYGEGQAHAEAIAMARDVLGYKASRLADQWLTQTRTFRSEASVIGLLLFVFGVSRVFANLTSAIEAVWDEKVDVTTPFFRSVLDTLKRHSIAAGLGLSLGVMLCITTIGHALLNAATERWLPNAVVITWIIHVVHIVITAAGATLVFSTLFAFLPKTRPRWSHVLPGSAIAAALFTLGNIVLAEYFERVDVGVGYGTAGSIVVVLIWLGYSGQIFMFGAELARIFTERRGRREPKAKNSSAPAAAANASRA
ncbi:MAG: YihY/virulence factor BrkB family protein [Sandaracinaceae bacterium]|nr:YihY/virulence factor BrkB family protein [Sandaracinaceae bacterium]